MKARILLAVAVAALVTGAARAAVITEADLKARIEVATKDFKDMTALAVALEKNKEALARVDPQYAQFYEFKSAQVFVKLPDKLRMESKLGAVRFEYIVNGARKTLRSPTIKMRKTQDFVADPAKLNDAFDIGLVTTSLWRTRRVEVLDDPEAEAAGEIKLRLYWPKGEMICFAWIDAQNLWLKRFEKRDPQNVLKARIVYSNPSKIGGVIWMPLRAEMYAGDGAKAGATEFSDVKVNVGLEDSIFQ